MFDLGVVANRSRGELDELRNMLVEISKEEAKAVIIQLGARLDDLNELVSEAGAKKDIKRVKELIEFMKPIEDVRNRLYEVV